MQTFAPSNSPPSRRRARAGFTITEMAIVSLLLALVLGSIIGLAIFTLRLSSGANRQLEMDSQARVVNLLVAEVKSSQRVDIYTYDGATFTIAASDSPQVGNALSLTVERADGSTNQVVYYVDTQGQLSRGDLSDGTTKKWMKDITSATPFTAKDFRGTILMNHSDKMLIDVRITGVDSNTRDFRQTITRQVSVNKRNPTPNSP